MSNNLTDNQKLTGELTEKQNLIFSFIQVFMMNNQYPPTNREIAKEFCMTVKAAADHIKALEKKGYIKIEPGISRGISIPGDECPYCGNYRDVNKTLKHYGVKYNGKK